MSTRFVHGKKMLSPGSAVVGKKLTLANPRRCEIHKLSYGTLWYLQR